MKHKPVNVYVQRKNNRLAMYGETANREFWDDWLTTSVKNSDETLRYTLRPSRKLRHLSRPVSKWIAKDGVVLEAGCGTGIWVRRLRDSGWNCLGLDHSIKMLNRSNKVDPTLPLIVGDVFHLPVPDNSLAGYISLGVVEHFPDGPSAILSECARALHPGGVALISVPYASPARQNLPSISEDQALSLGLEFYQHLFTKEDLYRELKLAGLTPTNQFYGYGVSIGLQPILGKWLSRLGPFGYFLDLIPGLPWFGAHMMFTVSIKPQ